MSDQEWDLAVMEIAQSLGIPLEHHQGRFATEYYVVPVERPHHGLLGEHMFYWALITLPRWPGEPSAELQATIYQGGALETQHPIHLHLHHYPVSALAWDEVNKADPPITDGELRWLAWLQAAKMLINNWMAERVKAMGLLSLQ